MPGRAGLRRWPGSRPPVLSWGAGGQGAEGQGMHWSEPAQQLCPCLCIVTLCVCFALHGDMGTLLVHNGYLLFYAKSIYKDSSAEKGCIGRSGKDKCFYKRLIVGVPTT